MASEKRKSQRIDRAADRHSPDLQRRRGGKIRINRGSCAQDLYRPRAFSHSIMVRDREALIVAFRNVALTR
jgi:hypothetical protein